jgi:hypothetical protein
MPDLYAGFDPQDLQHRWPRSWPVIDRVLQSLDDAGVVLKETDWIHDGLAPLGASESFIEALAEKPAESLARWRSSRVAIGGEPGLAARARDQATKQGATFSEDLDRADVLIWVTSAPRHIEWPRLRSDALVIEAVMEDSRALLAFSTPPTLAAGVALRRWSAWSRRPRIPSAHIADVTAALAVHHAFLNATGIWNPRSYNVVTVTGDLRVEQGWLWSPGQPADPEVRGVRAADAMLALVSEARPVGPQLPLKVMRTRAIGARRRDLRAGWSGEQARTRSLLASHRALAQRDLRRHAAHRWNPALRTTDAGTYTMGLGSDPGHAAADLRARAAARDSGPDSRPLAVPEDNEVAHLLRLLTRVDVHPRMSLSRTGDLSVVRAHAADDVSGVGIHREVHVAARLALFSVLEQRQAPDADRVLTPADARVLYDCDGSEQASPQTLVLEADAGVWIALAPKARVVD